MSGSGRKSAYRKGVTKKVLYDAPEPKENEQVVRVVGLRGSNLFEVEDAAGSQSLTMLPTKFRKLIWIKRGDFLIVASSDAAAEASTAQGKKKAAVTSIVEHILYKDQIKHLKRVNLWPEAFDKLEDEPAGAADGEGEAGGDEAKVEEGREKALAAEALEEKPKKNSGITMLDTSFADMHLNRNRRRMFVEEDEEEEDDEEDSD